MGFLSGKRALIAGVASNRSIAWGVAQAMHREGARLAFTYPNEKMKPRVEKLANQLESHIVLPCDVASDAEIDGLFAELGKSWDSLDILVHSIAFAPKEQLEGLYLDAVTRQGFNIAHEISSYSFAAMARAALPLMAGRNGSMLTLTYIGSVRSMPGYNVMGLAKASLEANVRYLAQSVGGKGIRVNGISAGPIRTLAAAGIKNFRKMLGYFEKVSPLGRAVTIEEVGNTAAFLSSDLASGITGEITYVDGGFNTVGISANFIEQDQAEQNSD
ncbi:enoyl-ACP reductase FabI [Candidatus Spongiihabitans sp.]|uniref:enoyl-ACP reductase FabI n=1 Tax=Candidatus Spongiihabitans sp. TaxID=3101308 RepID=UPI003C6FE814